MLAAIGDAKTCPHGHPIVAGAREAGVPLADVELGASVRVLRFENEAEDLLRYLKDIRSRARPRGTLAARDRHEVVVETADGRRCSVTPSVAETVSVIADPSPPPRTALPEQLVLGSSATAGDRYSTRATSSDRRAAAKRVTPSSTCSGVTPE